MQLAGYHWEGKADGPENNSCGEEIQVFMWVSICAVPYLEYGC